MTPDTEERDPYSGYPGTRTLDKNGNVIAPTVSDATQETESPASALNTTPDIAANRSGKKGPAS